MSEGKQLENRNTSSVRIHFLIHYLSPLFSSFFFFWFWVLLPLALKTVSESRLCLKRKRWLRTKSYIFPSFPQVLSVGSRDKRVKHPAIRLAKAIFLVLSLCFPLLASRSRSPLSHRPLQGYEGEEGTKKVGFPKTNGGIPVLPFLVDAELLLHLPDWPSATLTFSPHFLCLPSS